MTARPGTGSSRAGPSGPRRARRSQTSASISGSSAPRGGVYVAWPMPDRELLRRRLARAAAGPVSGSSMRRWACVRFDSGRKMLPLVMKRCSRFTRESPLGRVDHRDAGATVVREHDHRLEAQHFGHVVLEHLGVAHEAVAPAERLVGEAEAREVHRADAKAVAQSLGDFEPVDAAGRKAVDQHERRRVRVTELDVEDLHLGRISAARTPTRSSCLSHATRLHDSCRRLFLNESNASPLLSGGASPHQGRSSRRGLLVSDCVGTPGRRFVCTRGDRWVPAGIHQDRHRDHRSAHRRDHRHRAGAHR